VVVVVAGADEVVDDELVERLAEEVVPAFRIVEVVKTVS
jgi:hypothetical protein